MKSLNATLNSNDCLHDTCPHGVPFRWPEWCEACEFDEFDHTGEEATNG